MFPNTLRENEAEKYFLFFMNQCHSFTTQQTLCGNNTPFSITRGIPWFVSRAGDHITPLGSATVTFCIQLQKLEVTRLYM